MNEENKPSESGLAPQPSTQNTYISSAPTVVTAPGSSSSEKPKRSLARIVLGVAIGVAIIIVVLVLIGIGLVTYVFTGFTSTCNAADKNMKQAEASLQTQATGITVDGQHLESVSVYANGDCLTGSGAVLDASVAVNTSARSAHAAMLQAFGLNASDTGKMEAGTANGSNDIESLIATVKEGDHEYAFTYYFAQPPGCPPGYSGPCYSDPDIMQKLSLLDKPVKLAKVNVTQFISQQ